MKLAYVDLRYTVTVSTPPPYSIILSATAAPEHRRVRTHMFILRRFPIEHVYRG